MHIKLGSILLRFVFVSAVRRAVDDDSENDGLPDHLDDADLVEARYKGGHIPSKAFKALQMYIKDDDKEPPKKSKFSSHYHPKILTLLLTGTKIAKFANSEDLDEVAHYEPPHLNLHC